MFSLKGSFIFFETFWGYFCLFPCQLGYLRVWVRVSLWGHGHLCWWAEATCSSSARLSLTWVPQGCSPSKGGNGEDGRQWNTSIQLNEEIEVKTNSLWRETRVEVPAKHRELGQASFSLWVCYKCKTSSRKRRWIVLGRRKGQGTAGRLKEEKHEVFSCIFGLDDGRIHQSFSDILGKAS